MKIKIAITGGPSAGKTTLIEALHKDLNEKVSVVPEAATILYRGGFPRRPSRHGREHSQRAIFFIQRELENLIEVETLLTTLVCDRGSLDSLAYWPGKAEDFFLSVGTTRQQELQRYQWVIHLDTTNQDSFDKTNPLRVESHNEAVELNRLTLEAWSTHPQRIIIPHETDFLSKIVRAKSAVEKIMAGQTYADILKLI